MYELLNTLYVMTPESYLHLQDDTLCVDVAHIRKLQVPLHHLSAVVCVGPVMVSPGAMHRCADLGITLVLLDWNGRFKARLEGPTKGNVLLRHAQYQATLSPQITLALGQAFVAGKLRNTRYVLLRAARESQNEASRAALREPASELGRTLRRLPEVDTLEALRGWEGDAAKRYFTVWSQMIRPDQQADFALNGRSRRPPLDRANALLSFLYALLMNDCRSALESVGLDPQMGFLHTVRPGRAALALDLMEEFRPLVADRLALTLINRLQVQANDFVEEGAGSIRLRDDARKQVVVAYQERKKELIQHPFLSQAVPWGLVPQLQARLLARVLRGDLSRYVPFTTR